MGTLHRSGVVKKSNDNAWIILTAILCVLFGFFIGLSFPTLSLKKIYLSSGVISSIDLIRDSGKFSRSQSSESIVKIYVPTNPRGAESLPPDIVEAESDFFLRRLWGEPSEFSQDFQILLFHYDGRTSEWDNLEWSRNAIHISVKRQTKWWSAKMFLHPDTVAAYDYIFMWDEDLGVEYFNGDKYIQLVKKHGLEISQPGLEPNNGLTWQMTKRRGDREVPKDTQEKPGWCTDPHLPPCAVFVEIMAPIFSREAWRCVWHMIQNDLVHGWGLDFALKRCVEDIRKSHDLIIPFCPNSRVLSLRMRKLAWLIRYGLFTKSFLLLGIRVSPKTGRLHGKG